MSNREIFDRALGTLSVELNEYLTRRLGVDWIEALEKKDIKNNITGRKYQANDTSQSLRMFTDRLDASISAQIDVNNKKRGLASEVREFRNRWAHGEDFSDEDVYRALDSIQRLTTAIGTNVQIEGIAELKIRMARAAIKSRGSDQTEAELSTSDGSETDAVGSAGNGNGPEPPSTQVHVLPQAVDLPRVRTLLREGDIVQGVFGFTDIEGCSVNLDNGRHGTVPSHELSFNPSPHLFNIARFGRRDEFYVLDPKRTILSRARARQLRGLSFINAAGGKGGVMIGQVVDVDEDGLILDVGFPGFVPRELSGNNNEHIWVSRLNAVHYWRDRKLAAKIVDIDYKTPLIHLSRTAWVEDRIWELMRSVTLDNDYFGEMAAELWRRDNCSAPNLPLIADEAAILGISSETYLRILNGLGDPSESDLDRVASMVAFGIRWFFEPGGGAYEWHQNN